MIYLDILYIAIIVVCITDQALFFNHLEEWLSRKLGGDVHFTILECSLCQTWWLSLIYLLATNSVSIQTIAYALLVSVSTTIINDAIYTAKGIISMPITLIQKLIEKCLQKNR